MSDTELEIDTQPATLIRRLNQIAVARFASVMAAAQLDLTPVQYAALSALTEHPGVDQATLATLVGYDRATLGKVVERLEAKSLLVREVDPRDRRARCLRITQEGDWLVSKAQPLVNALQPQILNGLNAAEREELIYLLKKVTRAQATTAQGAQPVR